MARLLLAVLALLPTLCAAGPWLRAEGSTYLSFSAEIAEYQRTEGWLSVYAEHGLTEALTLGLDAGGRDDGSAAKALVFARLPILGEGTLRVAAQIGAGAWLDDGEVRPVLRPGLSVGRGLSVMEGGWIAADIYADVDAAGAVEPGLDAVLGLRPSYGGAWLLGLRGSGDGLRLVPGYERPLGPVLASVSAIIDPEGEAPPGLMLRTALEF